MATISRQLSADQGGLYINKFISGLYSQRNPLFTPTSAMGLQMISRLDSLWDGLNIEISSVMTLQRRPGYPRFCSAAFGSSDYPLAFFSFKNLAGTIKTLADCPTKLVSFTTSAQTTVFSKSGTGQGSMEKVGDTLYYCDGTDADSKKWDQTTASKWGIVGPSVAPTLSFGAGSLSPRSGYTYCYVYKNNTTGHPSNASPRSANTGSLTSQNITVSYTASTDPQVDKIDIYRNDDGGGIFYYLATVANATSTYTDSIPDSGLNNDIIAPLVGNEPPPSGISLVVFYLGRMWVATGNKVYFGSGPDCTNGVPEEAFYNKNNFSFPGKVTALVPISIGLLVFTRDDLYIILGSDLASFYPKKFQANLGVLNQNCVAQDGDLVFIFTSRGQLFELSGENEIGFPIRGKLAAINPANAYLALHRSGDDEGLFISDGSANIYRYSLAMQCWSTKAQPVGGIRSIASIETSTAVWSLVAGRTAGSGYILSRNLTTFQDDGVSYDWNVEIGAIVGAPPGKFATVESVLLETTTAGTYPTVAVRFNEISGTYTTLPNPVPDPPKLPQSSTLHTKRHNIVSATTPLYGAARMRFVYVKISSAATEATRNEILGLAFA